MQKKVNLANFTTLTKKNNIYAKYLHIRSKQKHKYKNILLSQMCYQIVINTAEIIILTLKAYK